VTLDRYIKLVYIDVKDGQDQRRIEAFEMWCFYCFRRLLRVSSFVRQMNAFCLNWMRRDNCCVT